MEIISIEIQNIKGISILKHCSELSPNKVNIFVAPNGFGKTSFSTAFKYLTDSKIDLNEKHLHNNDSVHIPLVKLKIRDKVGIKELVADNTKNEIRDTFDIFVINSQLKASGTVKRYAGRTISKYSLDIEATVLIEKVPEKANFEYKISNLKKDFGANSKVLSNIETIIHKPRLLKEILLEIDLDELKLRRTLKPLEAFINEVNKAKGNEDEVLKYIEESVGTFLNSNKEIDKLTQLIQELKIPDYESIGKSFLMSCQLIKIFNKLTRTQINKVFNYYDYLSYFDFAKRFISDFNTTRFTIVPKVHKGKLIINWPKAHEISNGQRDILNFVALLLKARLDLRKENQMLIIDEVFDYLDDANLISFQYFITDLIEKAKANSVNFFPILLTHLDPNFFNHFCFSDGKLKVFYLKEYNADQCVNLHKIIYCREESTIKDDLDEYFFHFNPKQIDIQDKFEKLGLVKEWGDTNKFHKKIYREVNNYLDGREYEPLAICFALRKVIEMKVYNLIFETAQKHAFLKVHGTKNKLLYVQSLGIDIPETFFLLGILYNTSLHLYNGQNITNSLAFKLENLTIRKLIHETCKS